MTYRFDAGRRASFKRHLLLRNLRFFLACLIVILGAFYTWKGPSLEFGVVMVLLAPGFIGGAFAVTNERLKALSATRFEVSDSGIERFCAQVAESAVTWQDVTGFDVCLGRGDGYVKLISSAGSMTVLFAGMFVSTSAEDRILFSSIVKSLDGVEYGERF
jgi:hypothetical protein